MSTKDLERLVAIEDLRSLQSRYVRYADNKDWHLLANLFLPDAKFIPHGVDGKPQVTMSGREEIARRVSNSVGAGTVRHHLFSYEIEIDSSTSARGIWAMEDWIDRSECEAEAGISEAATRPFRTMHGYGYYHAAYQESEGSWFIAELKLFRTQLDFTY